MDICPWALREGVILRRLDSEADGTAFMETSPVATSVRDAGGQLVDRNAAPRSRGNKP
ncbi:exopolyphosphatase domain protein [Mycobacterium kansasii]|uniref:Exopolyphosphatase domain protein n=1 Tax=Mycobacterium kansasii TaxID=1768 RepID=A0A1V3WR75_MYCKA|nr:exopolyphosphatase domain protein [Mycobacterium kansasii]